MTTTSNPLTSLLESIFNHVALPRRLPGKQDNEIDEIERALTSRLLDAIRTIREHTRKESGEHWDYLRRSLDLCKVINDGGCLSKVSLVRAFRELDHKELLILHVAEQNAAILIRRHHNVQGESVIFEAFEASPISEEVLASQNALQWDFPGCAIAIPYLVFVDSSFQDNLAAFLEQASTESIKRFAAHTNKAGSFAFESRETADPSLVTGMLMDLLEGNGHRIFPPLLRKRVRDDVCWVDGAEKPWRRCPFWLVLRVAIQRHLYTLLGGEAGRVHYKFLVCLALAGLLDDTLQHLTPESLAFLKAKLCRRLVKLQVDKDRASDTARILYEYMFTNLSPLFDKTTQAAVEHISAVWDKFKKSIRRPIPPLPRRADQRDLFLTLPNSQSYLEQVLAEPLYRNNGPRYSAPNRLPADYDVSAAATKRFTAFADGYFSLSEIEIQIELSHAAALGSDLSSEARCIELARRIDAYVTAVGVAYESNPEQKSIMLLTVMELWKSMDECATKLFSLLEAYNPGIPPETLDVLQLSRFQDMCRLQKIQEYLQDRLTTCKGSHRTIFDNPTKGCFAERYFNESPDSTRLQELHQRIETAAELARTRKEQEWQTLSAKHEKLVKDIAGTPCVYTMDDSHPPVQVHDSGRCRKCYLRRKAKRMKIWIHEHPLPSNVVEAHVVVFELGCVEAFAAYRDATWKILGTLACPKQMKSVEPRVLLRKYSELQAYVTPQLGVLSLASTTKSFLTSHYSTVSFPVSLKNICHPNGLKFMYFDSATSSWPGVRRERPTFAHHCRMVTAANSPFSYFQSSPDFAVDAEGPSSYEIIASQTRCPSGLNIHEFMTYQTLFSGKSCRLASILTELGSSNLNFSTEASTSLLSQLALLAGPADKADPLRVIHKIFRDESFCMRLMEQLGLRLKGISPNWREIHCMEMLVTLILRLCSVASGPAIISEATKLLERARAITSKWISLLRKEIHQATDTDSAQRCSRYAFWAALLCRRTFAIHAEREGRLQPTALRCFVESSITMQDSIMSDPSELPPLQRNALIRDLKMVYRMRFALRQSLDASPRSLTSAINSFWPEFEGDMSFDFLPYPNEWWIEFTVEATQQAMQQTVHYHLLHGHLLIGGKPLGKLPAEHRNSVVLMELFGNQSLMVYPSGLPHMAYALTIPMHGHRIHLGFRNGELITRAYANGRILEFIPRQIFGTQTNFDLPASLVENCVHWLDIHTGIIEIRKRPHIWQSRSGNWVLDFKRRLAQRRTVLLVDPRSALFRRVSNIFKYFEYPHRLTLFQPERRSLTVELRSLELSFFVNARNLLQSSQLRSEIDPYQDVGTFYGLNSMIVLRDAVNRCHRSLIVPLGAMNYQRNGIHIAVELANNGDYARYTVNDVLGRLECPAEPLLLYLKAQLHAYTSFVVPDSLTALTGTEEALHCLLSGYCQPWSPLNLSPYESLKMIAKLSPKRTYYPDNLRVIQNVFWDDHLTAAIQHEAFWPIVENILQKSKQLSVFAPQRIGLPSLEPAGDRHLSQRSLSRYKFYQRPNVASDGQGATPDQLYHARDGCQPSQRRLNVLQTTSLIRAWPSRLRTTSSLAGILENWQNIGGYDHAFDKILLTDILNVDFAAEWGSLINLCRMSEPKDRYRLMFMFAAMSFRNDVDMDIVRVLIAFSVLEDLKALVPPKWPSYSEYRQNHIEMVNLMSFLKPCCIPYPGDERENSQFPIGLRQRRMLEARELSHEQQAEKDCKAFAQSLLNQWPCPEPTIEGSSEYTLLDFVKIVETVLPAWHSTFRNFELSKHIAQVQSILNRHHLDEDEKGIEPPKVGIKNQEVYPTRCRGGEFPTLQDLLRKAGPLLRTELHPATGRGGKYYSKAPSLLRDKTLPHGMQKSFQTELAASFMSTQIQELKSIIDGITQSESTVRQHYGRDLMQSLNALRMLKGMPKQVEEAFPMATLSAEILKAGQAVRRLFDQVCEAFELHDARVLWMKRALLWPSTSTVTLLEQLRSTSTSVFGGYMKESLIKYALLITEVQRLMRIEDAHRKGNNQRLHEEQQNVGHGNWQPANHTDWVLLEIDANILIRDDQVEVALATISPNSKTNSVLQMNMGQAQLLQGRLGGLLGREIKHIPFSRRTPTKSEILQGFHDIHKEVLKSAGLLLALPEHILSFMLSGLQRLSDARLPEASSMVKVQTWLSRVCRDVLDESDITLAVRTQLIYPSGSQRTVDGHPHRWETAEALLRLVDSHLTDLKSEYPNSIEVVRRPRGGFPVVFFLRQDVEDALIMRLVDDICSGRSLIMVKNELSQADRLTIRKFISWYRILPGIVARVHRIFHDDHNGKKITYLLRGLIVHRIFLLSLKKRWNVQYGLHPNRDPIAVPFHAKGVPTEHAEWGHCDVSILLTCLAFYYQGLNIDQLRQSFKHILQANDPMSEYDRWVHSLRTLPDSLREFNAINVDDEAQLMEIWQHARHSTTVIDYYLNNFVFPKHAKQFQMKLQASGWDIPLFSPSRPASTAQQTSQICSKYSQALTTGFSGTNDNRMMLPLTIKQEDLSGLSHTNAEVLTYLLETRNRRYVLAADDRGRHLSEISLLQLLKEMNIRILIDAGAQILEMGNLDLVREWLKICYEAPAAVYFDTENKPWVLYREGRRIPFLASPFVDSLDDCLVYLDQAHTRGTDLKMPTYACGALTLGLEQTKDHTLQAAMRLRQLATSQSVVFFAPPEVHQSILDLRKKKFGDLVDSYDVICWLLEQTCVGIEQLQPLYYSQGVDFCQRTEAALRNASFLVQADHRSQYLDALRQTEQYTLEELYEPRRQPKSAATLGSSSPEIAAFATELDRLRKGFQDTGHAVHGSALQEVEQEREIALEVEAVREVQKPVHYSALPFRGLHEDIRKFVKTGILAATGSTGYEQVFVTLRRTGLGQKYGINSATASSRLYVSMEFTRTVKLPLNRPNDNFQRPVNWLLWSMVTDTAVIIIPEEAEIIIPLMRQIKQPLTHLLTYAAPVTRKMLQHINNLKFYAIPALPTEWKAPMWLKIELGIFAGRLYFEYDEYSDLRKYLGLADATAHTGEITVGAMVSAEPSATDTAAARSTQIFTTKSLMFLQEWLAIRRKGQDFTHTPMGYVCQGKPFTAEHPFFASPENDTTLDNLESAELGYDDEKMKESVGVDTGEEIGFDEDGGDDEEANYDDEEVEEGENEMFDDLREFPEEEGDAAVGDATAFVDDVADVL
ncbi:MAG: hypothetical protein M1816_001899 [Peltula sp. TS41687]|nr:MAG: hypothetical protein M1816_001899 [Peltula sp. TS41687]